MLSNTPAASGLTKGFRSDINGLRAWAVLAVVLYHFGFSGLSGGFAGVDVFFVISGFLMAGIVITGLEQRKFSIGQFYLARARRIWPALLVLVAVVLCIGWFVLMPSDYQLQGKHARDSLLFSSNLRYAKEAGYFDTVSHGKWLLHTWSLSVEWQFYLLYPLVLSLLWRFWPSRRAMLIVHVLALLGSLLVCQWYLSTQPIKAFYLLQARAWELLLGGVVYLLASRWSLPSRFQRGTEWVGLLLILFTVLWVDGQDAWPGWRALIPAVGAGLVLLAGRQQSLALDNPVFRWLGLRSYSVYLWHWPVVVLLTFFGVASLPAWVVAGIAASLILGELSYRWVELPAQRQLAGCRSRTAAIALLGMLLVVTLPAQWVRKTGVPGRLPAEVVRIDAEQENRNPRSKECLSEEAECVLGGSEVQALLFGDSHADAVASALVASLPSPEGGVAFRAEKGCLFVLGSHRVFNEPRDKCDYLKDKVFRELDDLYPGKPIVIVNRTSVFLQGELDMPGVSHPGRPLVYFTQRYDTPTETFTEEFRQHYVETACRLARHHPLYLVRPFPEMPDSVPLAMGRALMRGNTVEITLPRSTYAARHAAIWSIQDEAARQCGAKVLDPLPYLCDEQFCYGSQDGMPLYVDDDHLSERGNRLLIPMFSEIFRQPGLTPVSP